MRIRQLLKKGLIKSFNPIALALGYQSPAKSPINLNSANDKNTLLSIFYNTLKFANFTPLHIVDVGANHGTWTREALKAFPDSQYTLLEPQFWLKESIKDLLENNKNISFNAVGAGSKSGSFKFTIVDRDDSCSFRYSESEAKEKGFKQIEVPIVTLNQLVSDQRLSIPDIVKIDAEGLDIDVLQGASDFFGKTEIFMVEAGVINKEFSNTFLKLIIYMDTNGYTLFEITDLNRPFIPAVLWLVELVFVKKGGLLDSYKWI